MSAASHSSSAAIDYTQARTNMVQCQLNPSGIVSENVLAAYQSVPRELFVPKNLAPICYQDECLSIDGRQFLQPLIHAQMVEHLGLKGNEHVLDVGGLTGYSAAILRTLSSSVIALEDDAGALASAQNTWAHLGFDNITPVLGNHAQGTGTQGSYDAILINGAVCDVPEVLLNHLKPNGRLACVLKPQNGIGKITIFERDSSSVIDHRSFQDAFADYLIGFAPVAKFIF